MQDLKLKMLGECYTVTSLQRESMEKNRVLISPTLTEKLDFSLSYSDIPAPLASILAGYFLIFHRGLPLSTLSFLAKGEPLCVERVGAYLYSPFKPVRIKLQSAMLLGVETPLYETEQARLVLFKSESAIDPHLLENIRLYGEGCRRLLPLYLDTEGYRLTQKTRLDLDSLFLIGTYLTLYSKTGRSARVFINKECFYFQNDGGTLKIGARPSLA